MAIGVQTMMATPSLATFGTEELKQRYLAPAIRGEQVAAIGVTEPDAGSDVAAIRTRAVRDGDEWVINGRKLYITNGVQADWVCLLARTSDVPDGAPRHRGMSQLIVPTDSPGFRVSRKLDKLGQRSSDTAELALDDVRIPVANTIGTEGRGFQQQMAQFVVERMFAAYTAVGSQQRALDRTRDYLRQRTTFGQPLIANQYIAFRLAELAAEVDLLRQYNYATAEAYMRGENTTRQATIAKLKAGRLSREVADACMQFHGGIGYMEETWTVALLPRLPPDVDRRRRRRGHAPGARSDRWIHPVSRAELVEVAARRPGRRIRRSRRPRGRSPGRRWRRRRRRQAGTSVTRSRICTQTDLAALRASIGSGGLRAVRRRSCVRRKVRRPAASSRASVADGRSVESAAIAEELAHATGCVLRRRCATSRTGRGSRGSVRR